MVKYLGRVTLFRSKVSQVLLRSFPKSLVWHPHSASQFALAELEEV